MEYGAVRCERGSGSVSVRVSGCPGARAGCAVAKSVEAEEEEAENDDDEEEDALSARAPPTAGTHLKTRPKETGKNSASQSAIVM